MDIEDRQYEIEGRRLRYPTAFRDGRSATGLFVVEAAAANALIADSDFRVAEAWPGRALFTLACVEYTETDCGSYLETAQAFFIERPDRLDRPGGGTRLPWFSTWSDLVRGHVASFTWALQVTTVLSQRCGIEMWGYPKTVERIEREEGSGGVTFSMWKRVDGSEASLPAKGDAPAGPVDGVGAVEDELVFRFTVAARGQRTPEPMAADVYSIFEGTPHVGQLHQSYRDMGARPGVF